MGAIRLLRGICAGVPKPQPSNAFYDEILTSQGSSLVETGDIDTTSERDTERLSAEDRISG